MSYRILLVEDNEMNRDMLVRRLQRRGFEMHVAHDGQQALDMVADVNPTVILMDMSLPVVDGYEATRRLKADSKFSDIPIIGLSAHALSQERQAALDAGCDDYDTKPVDLNRLLEIIERFLPSD